MYTTKSVALFHGKKQLGWAFWVFAHRVEVWFRSSDGEEMRGGVIMTRQKAVKAVLRIKGGLQYQERLRSWLKGYAVPRIFPRMHR